MSVQAARKGAEEAGKLYSFDAGKMEGDKYSHITQCDISSVPLKKNSVDVVVFCLSLMGTNFPRFIHEANRILKDGGKLFVAEVLSRFENVEEFTEKYMKKFAGFEVVKQSKLKDFFYIFVFKKTSTAVEELKFDYSGPFKGFS